jgi:hypothetical protein
LGGVEPPTLSAVLAYYEDVSVNLGGDAVSDELAVLGEELLQHGAPGLRPLASVELQPRGCGGFVNVGDDVVMLIHRPGRHPYELISLGVWEVRREDYIGEREVGDAVARSDEASAEAADVGIAGFDRGDLEGEGGCRGLGGLLRERCWTFYSLGPERYACQDKHHRHTNGNSTSYKHQKLSAVAPAWQP